MATLNFTLISLHPVYCILDMNRTLLVEEGDDEGNNRQDKKKRDKEKFPDTAGNLFEGSLKIIFRPD